MVCRGDPFLIDYDVLAPSQGASSVTGCSQTTYPSADQDMLFPGGIGNSYTLSVTCAPSMAGQLSFLPASYNLQPLVLPLSVSLCGQGTEQVRLDALTASADVWCIHNCHSPPCV